MVVLAHSLAFVESTFFELEPNERVVICIVHLMQTTTAVVFHIVTDFSKSIHSTVSNSEPKHTSRKVRQPYCDPGCSCLLCAPQYLGTELDKAKDKGKLTQMDLLHIENLAAGRDKFKTLRQIRSGNTKNRIIDFERL